MMFDLCNIWMQVDPKGYELDRIGRCYQQGTVSVLPVFYHEVFTCNKPSTTPSSPLHLYATSHLQSFLSTLCTPELPSTL